MSGSADHSSCWMSKMNRSDFERIDLEGGNPQLGLNVTVDSLPNPKTWSMALAAAGLEDSPSLVELHDPVPGHKDPDTTVRLGQLIRMNLYQLQKDLLEEVALIKAQKDAPAQTMARVRKKLKHYVCAIRDIDFIEALLNKDPSLRELVFFNSKDSSCAALFSHTGLNYSAHASLLASTTAEVNAALPFRQRTFLHIQTEKTLKLWRRLAMAFFGGSALIAPMLIMTLHPTRTTSLLTTSAFVLFVAVILAYFMSNSSSKDIIQATAAYAAVLVVFVGANASAV